MSKVTEAGNNALSVVNPVVGTFTALPNGFRNLLKNKGLIRNLVSRDISQRFIAEDAGLKVKIEGHKGV
mgnify:CR=1 FL=1